MDVFFGIEHLSLLDDAPLVTFDLETTGLQPVLGGLRLVQVAAEDVGVVVIDYWELDAAERKQLARFFAQERDWVAHNAVFDVGWLQEHSITPQGNVYCTMLASRLLSNGQPNIRNGLAPVVERFLNIELSKEQQRSDWSQPILTDEQLVYAAKDVEVLVQLVPIVLQRLRRANLWAAFKLECDALKPIAHMNRTGIPFNREKLQKLQTEYEEQIEKLGASFLTKLDEAMPPDEKLPRESDGTFNLRAKTSGSVRLGTKVEAGFNLNSPKQLTHKLTVLLGEAPMDSKTGKPSASRQALRGYAADHEVIQLYLSWKRAEKRRQMVGSLMEHQAADGCIKTSYMQLGADTGRFSARNPNIQQVPRDKGFRMAAEAPEGWTFVVADFGQMELRLAAAMSKDKRMISAFKAGEDLHTITAEAIYPMPTDVEEEQKMRRQVAKSANFGLLYGSGAKGLRDYAGAMGITMTMEEAAQIRDTFHETYAGVHRWQQAAAAAADDSKGDKWAEVRIPQSNLRRYLPGELNRLTTRCNTPVQGAGAAILKLALGRLWPFVVEAGESVVRIAGCVHDEILLLVRDGLEEAWAARLSSVMEEAEAEWLGDIPPLADAAWGKTWAEAK